MQQKLSTAVRHNWKLVVTIITFVAFGALMYALRREIADSLRRLDDINAVGLLVIPLFQAFYYHATTDMHLDMFRILGKKISYRNMFRVGLELNFVNNVFPSGGVSGFSYFGLRMRQFDVTAGMATLVQMMRFALIFVSFQILLLIGLFLLALDGRASQLMILVAGSLATLLGVGTLAVGFIIGSKQRINSFFTYITKLINRLIHVARPNFPETINIKRVEKLFTDLHENYLLIRGNYKAMLGPLSWALMINITEILTIYAVYVAFGEFINPGAVIIAYAVANFAGIVSVLPGGVGVYETLMTAVLAAGGVPPSLSIPVTVMYRIINMSIKMPIGFYFYHRTINSGKIAENDGSA